MRSARIAVTMAVAGAAVLSAAPAFAASPPGPSMSVSPATAAPGQSIMITATCSSTKPGWSPSASSDAFAAVSLTAVDNTPGMYVGYAQLPSDGRWAAGTTTQVAVSASCADGSKATASVTIRADGGKVPNGGAATGDGASLASVTGGTATGTLAGCAAAGLGFVAWRRRAVRTD